MLVGDLLGFQFSSNNFSPPSYLFNFPSSQKIICSSLKAVHISISTEKYFLIPFFLLQNLPMTAAEANGAQFYIVIYMAQKIPFFQLEINSSNHKDYYGLIPICGF
jgi:hypothetical protein